MGDPAIIAAIISGLLVILASIIGALIASERLIITNLFRWRGKLPRGFVILINGGSGVGKTTIAWALARKYNIVSVLGSDLIREALRFGATKDHDENQMLLVQTSFLAHNYLSSRWKGRSGEIVVEGFRRQSSLLVGPMVKIINRIRTKRDPAIIEGINLVASQIFTEIPNDPDNKVLFVNLYLDSELRHLSRLRERSDKAHEPLDLTDKYVANIGPIRKIDAYLKDDSQRLPGPITGNVSNVVSIENSGSVSHAVNVIDKHLKRKLVLLRRRRS